MQLKVREWGDGPRTAVLIHGYSDDHTTWSRVGPDLAQHGFQVLAPDLRGHGQSPRADDYELESFVQDLIDSLPSRADVIVGHSLGALALGLAVERLAPLRAVYVDPPWLDSLEGLVGSPVDATRVTRAEIEALAPHWSQADIEIEINSSRALDPRVADWIPSTVLMRCGSLIPTSLAAPSTLVLPSVGSFVRGDVRDRLDRMGFEFVTVPDAAHVIHRDNYDGFMSAVTQLVNVDLLDKASKEQS